MFKLPDFIKELLYKDQEPLSEKMASFRIVKKVWKSGATDFQIERRARFEYVRCQFIGSGNHFSTQEEATTFLEKYLTPPEQPEVTVVYESQI